MKKLGIITFTIIILLLAIAFLFIRKNFFILYKSPNINIFSGTTINNLKNQKEQQFKKEIIKNQKKGEEKSNVFKINNNSKYPQAKIIIKEGTGLVVALLNADPNAPYHWIEVEKHGEKTKIAVITGYIYTYIYEDLGIKISTSPLYHPYFFEKTHKLIIKRKGNIIYNNSNNNDIVSRDYIAIFFKDPKKSFEDEIKENHLSQGCKILTGIADVHPISKHVKGFQKIYIASMDGNLFSDGICKTDKQFPNNPNPISFYMNPKKPDRYYKFSYGDCAPGPCSIFGDIEFF